MKTRILLIALSIVALISISAAKVIKESPKSLEQSSTSQITTSPIGGLEAEDK